jgi:hypothetical protein
MNLVYFASESERPGKNLRKLFGHVEVIRADIGRQEKQLARIEEKLANLGYEAGDPDTFYLFSPALRHMGEVMSRKMLNYGTVQESLESVRFGDTFVRLGHAVSMPYSNDSDILIVAPHYEEDFAIVAARSHNILKNDNVRILFITDIPDKPGFASKSQDVYSNFLRLEPEQYTFAGIPDRSAHDNMPRIREAVAEEINNHKPRSIILPSRGRNFDHNAVHEASLGPALESGANVILGRSVQSTGFRPSLWHTFSDDEAGEISGVYRDETFGGPSNEHLVKNLFMELPEPLSRLSASRKSEDPGFSLRAYGFQPVRMDHRYRIPGIV